MESAIILTLRLLNSGASLAARPSSVVHTGVKSRGWENRMPHLQGESEGELSALRCRQKAVWIAWLECRNSLSLC